MLNVYLMGQNEVSIWEHMKLLFCPMVLLPS